MNKIGLFGGTFNPVHFGHLRPTMDVKKRFMLDKVYFIPAAVPPHKPCECLANSAFRMEMTRLAASQYPGFEVSDVEFKRKGASYTIDTVLYFKKAASNNNELYLIMGIDAFMDIDSWKNFKQIFEEIPIIVMTRPGIHKDKEIYDIGSFIKSKVSGKYFFSEEKGCFENSFNEPVFIAKTKAVDISASGIREMVKCGESIDRMVPEAVKHFILEKGLYL